MAFDQGESLTGMQLGPYKIERPLGRGGMGEVYLAHDQTLDRRVAIKFMAQVATGTPELVRRFLQEARAAARLSHANIVQIHVVDVQADRPYMVMEYVDGSSVDRMIGPRNPLPWQRAFSICVQVAAALECAHAQGIIHRDIKPANIIVDQAGRVRVTDFGIAKVLDSNTQLTLNNTTVGSPCYMSPEQCGSGAVVPASDLFSLGITLYEMLTGRLPFVAETLVGYARKIAMEPAEPLSEYVSDLPAFVQPFVDALLGKELADRYASATQVVEDLRSLHAGKPMAHLQALSGKAIEADASSHALVPQGTGVPGTAGLPAQAPPEDMLGRSLAEELMDTPRLHARAATPAPTRSSFSWWPFVAGASGVAALVIAVIALIGNTGPRNAPGTPPPLPPERRLDTPPPRPETLDNAQQPRPPAPGESLDGAPPQPANGMLPPPPDSATWPPPRRVDAEGRPLPPPPRGQLGDRRLPPRQGQFPPVQQP